MVFSVKLYVLNGYCEIVTLEKENEWFFYLANSWADIYELCAVA